MRTPFSDEASGGDGSAEIASSVSAWTTVALGEVLEASILELSPSRRYEVRVRGGNAAGWGNWSEITEESTSGLPAGGACLQDDAPCGMDNAGAFTDVTYTYNGLGCEFAPTVTLVGGNCLAYDDANSTSNSSGSNSSSGDGGRRLSESGSGDLGDFASGSGNSGSGDFSSGSGDGLSGSQCEANCSICGAPAVVEARVVDGLVVQLDVLDGGSGFSSAPTVSFSGGNCSLLPEAYAEIANGAVTAVKLHTPCISPGGNPFDRNSISDFASVRTTMHYAKSRTCGWRIKPSVVPTGYKLRLSFDYLNTEQGSDIVAFSDGDGGSRFSELSTFAFTEGGGIPPSFVDSIQLLDQVSGNNLPPARIAETGAALLVFTSDRDITKPGGFVFRYELQALQPPDRPAAVSVNSATVTRYGALVSWTAPSSAVPIMFYRVQWVMINTSPDTAPFELVISFTHSSQHRC